MPRFPTDRLSDADLLEKVSEFLVEYLAELEPDKYCCKTCEFASDLQLQFDLRASQD